MHYTTFGRTGLTVSTMGLGGASRGAGAVRRAAAGGTGGLSRWISAGG